MLESNYKHYFQTQIICFIEEYLIEEITETAPNIRENNINQSLILRNLILESYLNLTDEFLDLKYKWLQQVHELAYPETKFLTFLNSEFNPNLDLFKNIVINQTLFVSKKSFSRCKLGSSKSNINQSNKIDDTAFVIEEFLFKLCALQVATELIQKIEPLNLSCLNLTNLLGYSALGEPATETKLPDFTKLIQKIESLNLSWSNLTNLLEEPATEPKLPEITGLPTPAPIRAVVESHYRPDKWKRNANNHGVFEAASKTNPNNRVEVFISGEKDGDILAWEAALQVIDLMGIDAAKLQLVFASHLFNQHNPFQSNFSLKGTEVIKQIGWDKKHRLTVSEKLAELASIAFHLGRMLMECTWVEGKPKGNKVDVSVSVSPLWVVEVDARGQKNIFTGKVDAPLEVYINVSPGPWAEKWLNRMGIKAGIALHQFGWLATEILKIDPYHEELALKLAIHLTMVSRIKMWDKNQYEHKVGSLLEAVELESRINAARQEKREAYNLKQRWDNSLTLLMSMDWRVIFDDSTYPQWLRPNSQASKPSDWRKEKIIDRLWKAKLTIKPPDPIPALLAAKTEPLQLKPVARTKSEAILTGADIRKQREAKGVSQTALAEWAGKTKAWLCMVEKGKRKLDPKEAKELWAGIDFLANKSDQP